MEVFELAYFGINTKKGIIVIIIFASDFILLHWLSVHQIH